MSMIDATRTIDPITVEVVENGLAALIREMDATIIRTAMSTVIREVYDFGVSVLDADGRLVHGLWMSAELIRRTFPLDHIHEGDVFIFNDPYLSGGEMTHLGDTQITAPVFWEGKLVAFTAVWGHHMDVGGMSASGLPTTTREIYQEGMQIPAIKLFDRGVLNQGVMDLLARNSRTPTMMIGDTLAMTSACAVARRRLEELFERYGAETILGCFDIFAGRSRVAVDRLIQALPEVAGEFEDVVDNDGVEPGPIPIRLRLEKRDGRLVLDFTGTGPQARGPINLILSSNQAKPRIWRRILNMLGDQLGVDPSMSPNHGMFDLVNVVVPDGSLLKPRYPAAVASRHVTSVRTWEMVQGALARLYPDRVPACSQGSITTCIFRGRHPETGEQFVNMECVQGGGGGRPWGDGVDAVSPNKDLTIAPVEYLESTFPFMVERTRLRPDSGGAGRYRGGMGIERAFRVLAPELLLGYLDDRQQWPPWGLWGGRPGAPGAAYLQRASGEWFQLPSKLDDVRLHQGDRLVIRTGAGAGWGKPWERPAGEVRRDVLARLVTPERAWLDYGVAIDPAGTVDERATRERRAELAASGEPAWIDRGQRHDAPDPGQLVPRSGLPPE